MRAVFWLEGAARWRTGKGDPSTTHATLSKSLAHPHALMPAMRRCSCTLSHSRGMVRHGCGARGGMSACLGEGLAPTSKCTRAHTHSHSPLPPTPNLAPSYGTHIIRKLSARRFERTTCRALSRRYEGTLGGNVQSHPPCVSRGPPLTPTRVCRTVRLGFTGFKARV